MHSSYQHPLARLPGFTLLEMLVVLTLIGVLAGLALPNFTKMLESFTESTHWREFENELDGMPFRAFKQGLSFSLTTQNAGQLIASIPPGWQVNVTGGIRYQQSGWCDGGSLRLSREGQAPREYVLSSPRCAVGTK